jgi:hypothetical protein
MNETGEFPPIRNEIDDPFLSIPVLNFARHFLDRKEVAKNSSPWLHAAAALHGAAMIVLVIPGAAGPGLMSLHFFLNPSVSSSSGEGKDSNLYDGIQLLSHTISYSFANASFLVEKIRDLYKKKRGSQITAYDRPVGFAFGVVGGGTYAGVGLYQLLAKNIDKLSTTADIFTALAYAPLIAYSCSALYFSLREYPYGVSEKAIEECRQKFILAIEKKSQEVLQKKDIQDLINELKGLQTSRSTPEEQAITFLCHFLTPESDPIDSKWKRRKEITLLVLAILAAVAPFYVVQQGHQVCDHGDEKDHCHLNPWTFVGFVPMIPIGAIAFKNTWQNLTNLRTSVGSKLSPWASRISKFALSAVNSVSFSPHIVLARKVAGGTPLSYLAGSVNAFGFTTMVQNQLMRLANGYCEKMVGDDDTERLFYFKTYGKLIALIQGSRYDFARLLLYFHKHKTTVEEQRPDFFDFLAIPKEEVLKNYCEECLRSQ